MLKFYKQSYKIYTFLILLIFSLIVLDCSKIQALEGDCTWWSDIKASNSFNWKILAYQTINSSLSGVIDLGGLEPHTNDLIKIQINGTSPTNYRFHTLERDERHNPWFVLMLNEEIAENKSSDPFPFIVPEIIEDAGYQIKYGVGLVTEAIFWTIKFDEGEAWINGKDFDAELPNYPSDPPLNANITFIYMEGSNEILGTLIWNVESGLLIYAKIIGDHNSIIEIKLYSQPFNTNSISITSNNNHWDLIFGNEWYVMIIGIIFIKAFRRFRIGKK